MKRLVLGGTVLLAALPGAANAAPYPDAVSATPGLVGAWRLGEGSGTVAAALAGGVDGTWSGSVGLGTPGALTGDADTGVTLGGGGGLALGSGWAASGDLTLEAWVAVDAASSGTRYVLSKGTTTTGFQLMMDGSRRPAFSVGGTGGTATATGAALAPGTWHHLAATLTGGAMALYVDGNLAGTAVARGTVRRSAGLALVAGRYSQLGLSGLMGSLDDVAVYDRAIGAVEAAAHAAAGIDAAPVTVSVSGPPPATPQTTASFTLGASKARVTFSCSLDGAAATACTAPSYSGLGFGAHTLTVTGADRWGLASAPRSYAWTVLAPDRTPPDTVALALGAAPGATAGSVVFTATEPARFECKVGGASDWSACSTPLALPAGVAAVSVRAIDEAGNVDPSPTNLKLGEAPDGSEPTGAAAFASAAAGLAFTATRGGTLTCSLDGGAWSSCASKLSVDGLGWGTHAFSVRAAFPGGLTLATDAAWTAAAPAARIAALQFPVLLRRGRDGRARANGRKPALRFALNVAAGVRITVARAGGAKAASTLGAWSIAVKPGDAVVAVPDKVVRRLKRGRYRLVVQAAGARDVTRAFAVV